MSEGADRTVETYNVLQVARDLFGGTERKMRKIINSMDPQILVDYLYHTGWVEQKHIKAPGGTVFSYGKEHQYAVFLPTDKEYLDYEDRMLDALEMIVDVTPGFGAQQE